MKEYIRQGLTEYREKGTYPWHMPGHKRQSQKDPKGDFWSELFAMDFTEAKGLDDLHAPEEFIKSALDEISRVYGSYKSYLMVNGTTVGILAGIHGLAKRNGNILVARNCHKSVYNAMELLGLRPTYIVPKYAGVDGICADVKADRVREKLEEMKSQGALPDLVVITSPTYEGVISDIAEIADACHDYGVYLFVDEAQGAHFEFVDQPGYNTALRAGADLVVESLHKTMPSLTQTSVLHLNKSLEGTRAAELVEKYLHIFETSSPSYVFMQSMERAIAYGDNNRNKYLEYVHRISEVRDLFKDLKNIYLFNPEGVFAYDICKLTFVIKPNTYLERDDKKLPFTGKLFGDILHDEFGQTVELTSRNYLIAMTAEADEMEAFVRLSEIIKEIDGRILEQVCEEKSDRTLKCGFEVHLPLVEMLAIDAVNQEAEVIELRKSAGKISAGYVYAYPPGIPILVPGEMIDEVLINDIISMINAGISLEGLDINSSLETVKVLKNRI